VAQRFNAAIKPFVSVRALAPEVPRQSFATNCYPLDAQVRLALRAVMRDLKEQVKGMWKTEKSGTGGSLHTQEPVTVASFRTWRGWREYVARDRCLTKIILARNLGADPRAPPVSLQKTCDFWCKN